MTVLVRARIEVARAFTIRGWVGATTAVLAVAVASGATYATSTEPEPTVAQAMSVTSAGLVVSALAILVHANDVRHGTLARWVALYADRGAFVRAKLLAAMLVGTAVSLVAVLAGRMTAVVAGLPPSSSADQLASAGRTVAALTLSAGIALSIAVLARGVVAPFVVVLALLPLVESLVSGVDRSIGRWLPLSLVGSLTSPDRSPDDPSTWAGTGLLSLWLVALAATAWTVFARRDILASRR